MNEGHTPKQLLFGELLQRQPFYSPKKRWHDEVVGNLCATGVKDGWKRLCQDRKQWSEICSSGVNILAQNSGTVTCVVNIFSNVGSCFYCIYGRSFQRKSDLMRHQKASLVQGDTYNSAIVVHCTAGSYQVPSVYYMCVMQPPAYRKLWPNGDRNR